MKAAIGASYISNKYIVTNTLQNPNNTVVNLQGMIRKAGSSGPCSRS